MLGMVLGNGIEPVGPGRTQHERQPRDHAATEASPEDEADRSGFQQQMSGGMLGPQRRLRPKTRQMQPGLTINFMRYKPQRRPRPKTRQISRLRKCRGRTSAGRNGGLARRRGRSGDPVGVHQRLQFGAATEASPEDEADDAEVMRYILDDLTPQRRPRPKTRQIVLGGAQQVREGPASTEASPEDEADARKNSQGHS